MTVCDRSHEVAPFAEQCDADGDGKTNHLCCWLPDGHDGAHWDVADKVHWQQPEDQHYATEVPCPAVPS